jgi:hypothetical protein
MKRRFNYMNFLQKSMLLITLFNNHWTASKISYNDQIKHEQTTKTIFAPISAGSSLYTQYHKPTYIDPFDESQISIDFSASYKIARTHNGDKIAKHLFQYNPLVFQGNQVKMSDGTELMMKRQEEALVAEYFGFSPSANFNVSLSPKITNQILDLQMMLGSEKLWMQLNVPITYSKWEVYDGGIPATEGTLGNIKLQGDDNQNTLSLLVTEGPNDKPNPKNGDALVNNEIATWNSFNKVWSKLDTEGPFGTGYSEKDGSPDYDDTDSWEAFGEQEQGMGSWGPINIKVYNMYNDDTSYKPTGTKTEYSLTNKVQTLIEENESSLKKLELTQEDIFPAKSVVDGLYDYTFGNLKERRYNKFNFTNNGKNNTWGVSDLHFQIGYDFYRHEDNHFGLYTKLIIPCGTEINKEYFKYTFKPIIGNCGHYEFGIGTTICTHLFEKRDSSIALHLDGYLTHILKKKQFRVFDKTNMPMSRYAVVKQLMYDHNVTFEVLDNGSQDKTNDVYAYNHVLKTLGDINNGYFDIFANLRGEFIANILYNVGDFEIGLGYSLSGKSKELAENYYKTRSDINTSRYYYGFKANTEEDNLVIKIVKYTGDTDEDTIDIQHPWVTFPKTKHNTIEYIKAKTCGDVTITSNGAYEYGDSTGDSDGGRTDSTHVFTLPNYNRSGLMEKQILHRIFAQINYSNLSSSIIPYIGAFGAFGFGNNAFPTAKTWELGIKVGFGY